MKTKTALMIGCALTAGALVASLALYPALPDRIPTHWNLHGVADGWSGKTTGAFVAAAFMLLIVALIAAAEWLSPLNYKIEPFRDTFNYILVICAAMMLYIHAVLLATGLGARIDSGRWLIGGIFVFFAIPTVYADEVSHLKPVRYGLRVLSVVCAYKRGKYARL
jgi:uncharacterized membrane protein